MQSRTYQVNFTITATDEEIADSPEPDIEKFFEVVSQMLRSSVEESNEEFGQINEGITFTTTWIGETP